MSDAFVLDGPGPARNGAWRRMADGRTLPILTVLGALLIVWFLAAIWLNAPQAGDQLAKVDPDYTTSDLVRATWTMKRPVLPTPLQVGVELWATTVGQKITSKRSLVHHAGVTASATLAGFAAGTLLGVLLAVGIVHVATLDRSLMPWVIASQTVPILAIAPMIVVVLGQMGFTGLMPKAVISAYLCFFPVTIGMVKGLRSPDPLHLDLMRTYSASRLQTFFKLRAPASLPFLFPSLKVAIALGLVGAIVGELPTGAQAGLGARLLTGSYYGQTVQIWSALIMAALLALVLIAAVGLAERLALRRFGGMPA